MSSSVSKDKDLALRMLDTLEQMSLEENDTSHLVKVLISQKNLQYAKREIEAADKIGARIEDIYTHRPVDGLYHFFKMNEATRSQRRGGLEES